MYPGKAGNFSINWKSSFDKIKVLRFENYDKNKFIKPLKDALNILQEDNEETKNCKKIILLKPFIISSCLL